MESDETQAPLMDRISLSLYKYRPHLVWGAVALVVVLLVAGFWFWRQNAHEADANAALSLVISKVRFSPDRQEPPPAELLKVADEYPGTAAGGRAVVLAAASLFVEGKYSEARGQFERYLREYQDGPFAGQALLGVAASLDAEGKKEEALAAYKTVIDRRGDENVAPQAKLALARGHLAQDRLLEAKQLFEEVASANANSPFRNEAIMALQDLITKHPNLAPQKPASSTPSMLNLNRP